MEPNYFVCIFGCLPFILIYLLMMSGDKIERVKTMENDIKSKKSLKEFGYSFNDDGQLRHIETGESFVFSVTDDHSYNQYRYEHLGELLTNYVYELLIEKANLIRVKVPIESSTNEPASFIFVSNDFYTNSEKLLVLIHGNGVVRAGQWARRLLINDCIDSGTQLPFINRAVREGYSILVMNTNLNNLITGSDTLPTPIIGSSSPEEHADYVWKNIVSKSYAKHIAIVAHSYGGVVTLETCMENILDFNERVFVIALTDSVHSMLHQRLPNKAVEDYFYRVAKNWVSSSKPLDTPIFSNMPDTEKVSAGTEEHTLTSWKSINSIFSFIQSMYKQRLKVKM